MIFGKKQPTTAREAHDIAREHLTPQTWPHAASARVCCVYTSVMDSNVEVDVEGRCRMWHIDFYSPDANECFLVRVKDGKPKGKAKPAKTGARWPGVEYIFACYGSFPKGIELEPPGLGNDWADSAVVMRNAHQFVDAALGSDAKQLAYGPLCIVYPAECLTYLQPDRAGDLLHEPAPTTAAIAVIMSAEDGEDHDSFIIYADAKTGDTLSTERFRFPALFDYGFSGDW